MSQSSAKAVLTFLSASTATPLVGRRWSFNSAGGESFVEVGDGFGMVRIPSGRWTIEGWQEDFAALSPGEVTLSGGAEETVWVAEHSDLLVRVSSETGDPIPNAYVEWQPSSWFQESRGRHASDDIATRGETDSRGELRFRRIPIAWAGRILVSKSGFYPSQQTLSIGVSPSEALVEVFLQTAPSEIGWGIRCVDPAARPLEGVVAYADTALSGWPDAYPFRIGKSGPDGELLLDDWVESAYRLRFEGVVYPAEYTLAGQSLTRGKLTDVYLAKPLEGRIAVLGVQPGSRIEVNISGIPSTEQVSAPLTPVQLTHVGLLVESDGSTGLALPQGVPVRVTAWDSRGRSSVTRIEATEADWHFTLDFGVVEEPNVLLVPHGGAIDRVKVWTHGLGDPFVVNDFADRGEAVAFSCPANASMLQVFASDGRSALFQQRCGGVPEQLDVVFEEAHERSLVVQDAMQKPISDVSVVFRSIDRDTRKQVVPCWNESRPNLFRFRPDSRGTVRLALRPGEYEVWLEQLPWRESLSYSYQPLWPKDGRVTVTPGPDALEVVALRPRRIGVRLVPRVGQRLPYRWMLWDPVRKQGNVFQGPTAEVWITEEARSLEVRDEADAVLATIVIPTGTEPWHEEVSL